MVLVVDLNMYIYKRQRQYLLYFLRKILVNWILNSKLNSVFKIEFCIQNWIFYSKLNFSTILKKSCVVSLGRRLLDFKFKIIFSMSLYFYVYIFNYVTFASILMLFSKKYVWWVGKISLLRHAKTSAESTHKLTAEIWWRIKL